MAEVKVSEFTSILVKTLTTPGILYNDQIFHPLCENNITTRIYIIHLLYV